MTPYLHERARWRDTVWVLSGLCGVWLLTVVISGYEPYLGSNNHLQIPLVKRLVRPELYPHDPLVDALKYYSSPHWHAVAFLSRFISLDTLLLVLFLLSRLLLVGGAYALARAMVPQAPASVALLGTLVLALQPKPFAGGGTVAQSYYEHSSVAQAVLLWATAAFLRGRALIWAILLGLVFNLNALYAAGALVYYGMAWLLLRQHTGWQLRHWIGALVVCTVVASPALWMIAQNLGQPMPDWEQWLAVQRVRSSHHMFPLTFSRYGWLKLLIGTSTVLVSARLISHHAVATARLVYAWTAVMLGWVVMSFIAAYVIPHRLLLALQPIRLTDLWYPLAFTAAVVGTAVYIASAGDYRKALGAGVMLSLCFGIWRLGWFKQLALLALPAPAAVVLYRARLRLLSHILCGAYFVVLIAIAGNTVNQRGWLLVNPTRLDLVKPLTWIRDNSAIDDTILAPPNWGSTRLLSERSVFVSWKDGTATAFAPSYTPAWVERIRAFGWDPVEAGRQGLQHPREAMWRYWEADFWMSLYRRLDDSKVTALSRKFRITLWVVEENHVTRFPELFRADGWKVVQVTAGDSSTTPTSQPRRESQR